jgi:MtN3 and saliva related transmembrane protein
MIVKNMIINCIGFIGGSILGLQLIPQIYKAYKTKSTNDISTFFLLMNIVGLTLMTTYGICNNDMPLYLPTSISLMNSFILLLLIKVNKNNDESDTNVNIINV